MAELLHKTLEQIRSLPEAEIEEWRGYLSFKGECCPDCGAHATELMHLEVTEYHCGICGRDTKKITPSKPASEDD